jgi:hypothetical protein
LSWRDEIIDLLTYKASENKKKSNRLLLHNDYKPFVEKSKIINLYDILIGDGVIDNIGYDDFIKCFDLTKKPPVVPKVLKQNFLVLALMQIPIINAPIAKQNFDVNDYTKHKSVINANKSETDEFGATGLPRNKRTITDKIAKWLQ